MFDPTPNRPVLAIRVRKEMERDIKREAKKRRLKVSEEVRRRLEFYDRHAEEPASTSAE
jgi:hypothetical protein